MEIANRKPDYDLPVSRSLLEDLLWYLDDLDSRFKGEKPFTTNLRNRIREQITIGEIREGMELSRKGVKR